MYKYNNYEAGFDSSIISIDNWKQIMNEFGLVESVKTESGWFWGASETTHNFVITANNPITGYSYHNNYGNDRCSPEFAGYIGISGTAEFVASFFVRFKELAEHIKGENFGDREFI